MKALKEGKFVKTRKILFLVVVVVVLASGGCGSAIKRTPLPPDLSPVAQVPGTPCAYIIRNDRVYSDWHTVKPRLAHIAARSISVLFRNQGFGDMYRIYLEARQPGFDFNLAYIPNDSKEKAKELFDQFYMRKLFDLGYRMALLGYPWEKTPPGIDNGQKAIIQEL